MLKLVKKIKFVRIVRKKKRLKNLIHLLYILNNFVDMKSLYLNIIIGIFFNYVNEFKKMV